MKRFDEVIQNCHDLIDHSLVSSLDVANEYMECSTLSKSVTHLRCSRCLNTLVDETTRQVRRSPSSLWSDLCEQIYCDHGGNIHLNPRLVRMFLFCNVEHYGTYKVCGNDFCATLFAIASSGKCAKHP